MDQPGVEPGTPRCHAMLQIFDRNKYKTDALTTAPLVHAAKRRYFSLSRTRKFRPGVR
jgi:hypothetical protein